MWTPCWFWVWSCCCLAWASPPRGTWVSVGPPGVEAVSLAVVDGGRRWVVQDPAGARWTTGDAGGSWVREVDPRVVGSVDEHALIEIEARLAELREGSVVDGFPSAEELEASTEDAGEGLVSELQSELEADPWFLDPSAGGDSAGHLRGPSPEVRAVARGPTGELLAATATGPWWSGDDGATWQDLAYGEDEVRDLFGAVVDPGLVLVAGSGGVWRLVPRGPDVGEAAPFAPLAVLLAGAAHAELTVRRRGRWAAAVVPSLVVDGAWRRTGTLAFEGDTPSGLGSASTWSMGANLVWGPRGASATFDPLDPASTPSVVVVGTDLLVDDGSGRALVAAAVGREVSRYRTEVAEKVADLWRERQRVASQGEGPSVGLAGAVRHLLRIRELDARLDALADGAVTRWQASSAPERTGGP